MNPLSVMRMKDGCCLRREGLTCDRHAVIVGADCRHQALDRRRPIVLFCERRDLKVHSPERRRGGSCDGRTRINERTEASIHPHTPHPVMTSLS